MCFNDFTNVSNVMVGGIQKTSVFFQNYQNSQRYHAKIQKNALCFQKHQKTDMMNEIETSQMTITNARVAKTKNMPNAHKRMDPPILTDTNKSNTIWNRFNISLIN